LRAVVYCKLGGTLLKAFRIGRAKGIGWLAAYLVVSETIVYGDVCCCVVKLV